MSSNSRSLMFWRDLTPLPTPMIQPTGSSPRVLIVGGGVSGLVNAWTLLDKGYHVTIISAAWASYDKPEGRLTSQIAGALWEYPPAVCGQHTDKISLAKSKKWCMVAYDIWRAISEHSPELSKKSGVKMCPSDFYFPMNVDEDDFQRGKMEEIMSSGVVGFRRGAHLIKERRVDRKEGGVDAYEIQAPVIDTDTAMTWLMELVQAKGAKMETREIKQDLLAIEKNLLAEYDADVIVNCTGLSGTTLAGDKTCYPIRGGLIRVINDGKDFPKVTAGLTISADAAHDNEIVFIVPRSDNILILGGITEAHEWDLDYTLDSAIIKRMKERCERFLPDLKNARLDEEYPISQGLRPFRSQNIRVEREQRIRGGRGPSRVVHNYGHGGAGWSLSFGCAGDVLKIVKDVLAERDEANVSVPTVVASGKKELEVPMLVRDFCSSCETLDIGVDTEDESADEQIVVRKRDRSSSRMGRRSASRLGLRGAMGRKNLMVPGGAYGFDDGFDGEKAIDIPIRLRISISTETLNSQL